MARENKPIIAALIVSFATILILLGVLLFVLLGNDSSNSQTETSSDTQSQSAANTDLKNCISEAHSRWDLMVASDEASGSKGGQSNLDMDIVVCHQQYGN